MSPPSEFKSFNRCIPASDDAKRWGLVISTVGYTQTPPNSPYPPDKHPDSHLLKAEAGRTLSEYQVIYITHGSGSFWSEATGNQSIKAGSILFLFPGVRHFYRPDPQIGWHEHRVGFSGNHADRLMTEFFTSKRPVLSIGMNSDLINLFSDICSLTKHEGFGFRRIIAAKTIEILARAQKLAQGSATSSRHNERLVQKICCAITDFPENKFNFSEYAKENGLSYTSFRRIFKQQTGQSPNQYLLEHRICKAQTLLTNTALSVQSISEETGFDSSFYFSRFFKQRTGYSPLNYRKAFRESNQ